MNIFDFAIQMEHDGESFYRDIAANTSETGIRTIMTMLADDEKKHGEILEEMKTKVPLMAETTALDTAKNVFQQMKDAGGEFKFPSDEEKLYRKGMEIEQKSVDFYKGRADEAEGADQKALFEKLAIEEKKHYRILENLADFVAQPKTYLADARFSNLDEF